jgi:hypothetical protein
MTVIVDLNTDQTRFDLTAMIQEWSDFLVSSCGYDKADPALVSALVHHHNVAFHEFCHDEGMCWDDISGTFLVSDELYARMVSVNGDFPYSREAIDLVWADCFDGVNENFDAIEERLYQEREHGLV